MNALKYVSFVAIFALAACSSDAGGGNNDSPEDAGTDMESATDMGGSGDDDTGGTSDIGPEDTGTPEDMSSDDMGAGDVSDGGDMAPDMAEEDMGPDLTQSCAYPPAPDAGCPEGPFGPGTFLDTVEMPSSSSCCFDYTGDGNDDNKVGSYLSLASLAAGGDLNANIQTFIDAGLLVYLFEYAEWDNEANDASLQLTFLTGSDTDDDFTDNLAGTGDFNVDASSFEADGSPRWSFGTASVSGRVLTASDGEVQLTFPGLLDEVKLELIDVKIRADVVAGPDLAAGGRVELENGELGGVMKRDPFFESLNAAATNCGCIGQGVFAYDAVSDSFVCQTTSTIENNCNSDPDASSGCKTLASQFVCDALEGVSTDMDVDTTGDGSPDAYSLGMEFTGVGASLVGTNP